MISRRIAKLAATLMLSFLMAMNLALPSFATNIPDKPDFLIGPDENLETSAEIRDHILNDTIPRIINNIVGMMGILAFLGILFSAINMLTAYGNEDKLNRAKTTLRYSLMGFALIVFAYAIVSIVVAIALPQESNSPPVENETEVRFQLVPTAYAVSTDDLNTLFPSQADLIENQEGNDSVSLPSGDLVTEIVPAIVTNVFYAVGFLLFIAITVAGVLMVVGRGNEEQIKKAKDILIWGLVAIALVSLGYSIIYGIATINLNNEVNDTSDDVFTNDDPL